MVRKKCKIEKLYIKTNIIKQKTEEKETDCAIQVQLSFVHS